MTIMSSSKFVCTRELFLVQETIFSAKLIFMSVMCGNKCENGLTTKVQTYWFQVCNI